MSILFNLALELRETNAKMFQKKPPKDRKKDLTSYKLFYIVYRDTT